MAQLPSMPVWTDALIGDTTHLSIEEFGAYVMLLLTTWRNNGVALADDDARLARVCRVTLAKWARMRPTLVAFFDISDGTWRQKRLEKEWKYCTNLSEVQRNNANKRWKDKPLKDKETTDAAAYAAAMPTAMPNECPHTHTHTEKKSSPPVEPPSSTAPAAPCGSAPTGVEERGGRGSRLPLEFAMPPEWFAAASESRSRHGLPAIDLALEAEKFVNHFHAASGQTAVKRNWKQTWVNWTLKANITRSMNGANGTQVARQPRGGPATAIFAGAAMLLAEREAERQRAQRQPDPGAHLDPPQPLLDRRGTG